jgi:Ca-activated chloride channel family protein
VLAAGRPYWLEEPTHRVISGHDIMLAIDISGSMQETDMRIGNRSASRIDVLKTVVSTFIDRRRGDRLGLILFGTRAYTYVPLTFDTDALSELLDDVSSGLAGRLTAIGDAIGVAVKTLGEQNSKHKVLILVTDGSNTSGINSPLDAARIAASVGMTIYTIGVGNEAGEMRQLLKQSNIDPDSELNEFLLRQIAAISGGRYFRARDSNSLQSIYQTLDRLQPLEIATRLHRPQRALFAWPLGFGMAVLLVFMAYRVYRIKETART